MVVVNLIPLYIVLFPVFLNPSYLVQYDIVDFRWFTLSLPVYVNIVLMGLSILGGMLMVARRHHHFCHTASVLMMLTGLSMLAKLFWLSTAIAILVLSVAIGVFLLLRRPDVEVLFQDTKPIVPSIDWARWPKFFILIILFGFGLMVTYGYLVLGAFGQALSAGSGYESPGMRFMNLAGCLPLFSFLFVSISCLPFIKKRKVKMMATISLTMMVPALAMLFLTRSGLRLVGIAVEIFVMIAAAFIVIYHGKRNQQMGQAILPSQRRARRGRGRFRGAGRRWWLSRAEVFRANQEFPGVLG